MLVKVVRNDGIRKCGFPVYGKLPVGGCSVDGDVEEIKLKTTPVMLHYHHITSMVFSTAVDH